MDGRDFDRMMCDGLAARWAGGQAVAVRAEDGDSPAAAMRLYERGSGGWALAAGPWRACVGRNGVAKRREGDGRSPSGAFLLGSAFGHGPGREGMEYPYRRLDGRDRWIDDPSSPFYNRWARGPHMACGGGEELYGIPQYALALAVHCNDAAAKGMGSAIFVHVCQLPCEGTQGCTAVAEGDMAALLRWLEYGKRPVLVQGTDGEIERLMGADWGMLCLPPGWGFADDFIPDAQPEIRYCTPGNFTGRSVPGYGAPLAAMRTEALAALARAADELRPEGLGIRIYDAYRPQRATDAMIAWAEDAFDTATKGAYYPEIDKRDIPGRFVARRSAHRLGGTADLTLLDWESGRDLDMGGPFDFFGELSAYGYAGLTEKQAANRALLRDMMLKHGFAPYDREWWHFSHPVEGGGGEFEILPREYRI